MKKLITCALPYANGLIHFGHLAGTCLPSDVYAKFCRMTGDDVLFVCGSDEYGTAITFGAQLEDRTPQAHVDDYHPRNQALFEKLGFTYDHYSRTTWPGHIELVQQFFLDLLKAGYIDAKISHHLYSEADSQFLADRYVQGQCPKCGCESARGDECPKCGASYEAHDLIEPISKITGAPLTLKETKHWYLRLDKFREPLKKWLSQKEWKGNVLNYIRPYIEDLRPRAITRDLSWGVPVPLPEAQGKVLYVWFDAPIGYISASKEWALLKNTPQAWKEYWFDPKTELVQFLGKDNIVFHAVIFPAMLMGQSKPYKLVDEMPANEFYNLEGKKFSKSSGWTIDLEEVLAQYDPDLIRYMIAASAPENSDSEFTWKEFQQRINSELIGKWSNYIHRVMTFIDRKAGGTIHPVSELSQRDRIFKSEVNQIVDECFAAYSSYSLRRATQSIMRLAQCCNIYFDASKPWALVKSGASDSNEAQATLNTILNLCSTAIVKLLSVSAPILPKACKSTWHILRMPQLTGIDDILTANWGNLAKFEFTQPHKIGTSSPLFQKVEDEEITRHIHRLHSSACGSQES